MSHKPLDPSPIPPTDPIDFVPDPEPDTIATPEGDNEVAPGQPLSPANEPTPERPRGNEPHPSQPIRGPFQ
jgi:hypothetical protein